jgi:hypothetical protein
VGLITWVPRTCAVRQEVEAWGQQHGALPLVLEKPGRTRQEPPRRWHGQSVVRRVPVAYADGRLDVAEIRFLVVLGRNNPSLYTVNGRPLYVHLNGLAIVLLK